MFAQGLIGSVATLGLLLLVLDKMSHRTLSKIMNTDMDTVESKVLRLKLMMLYKATSILFMACASLAVVLIIVFVVGAV